MRTICQCLICFNIRLKDYLCYFTHSTGHTDFMCNYVFLLDMDATQQEQQKLSTKSTYAGRGRGMARNTSSLSGFLSEHSLRKNADNMLSVNIILGLHGYAY